MKPLLTLILLVLCLVSPLKAQDTDTILIHGKVIDQKNSTPLPFANVILGKKGTTTNLDGEFVLTITIHEKNNPLMVKYIGYETVIIDTYSNKKITVALEQTATLLDAITVYTADQVIQNVNNHHQINYEFKNRLLNTYYKETIKSSGETNYIAEGILKIYLPTIYSNQKTAIEVLRTRKKEIKELPPEDTPLISGHASDMIEGTARRNGSFLDPDHKNNYEFSKEDFTTYDGREVYILSFAPKNKKGNAKGLIYIDSKSKAIIKTEYYPIIKYQKFWTNVKWTEEYVEHQGTWLLQRVSYLGEWKHNEKQFSFEALLVVTQSKNIDQKPDFEEELAADAIFFKEAANFSDNFWDGYDYVQLTQEEKYSFAKEVN